MDLPEIPDEAYRTAYDFLRLRFDDVHEMHAQAVVARVWPFLYAAALRHAADEIDARPLSNLASIEAAFLRRMADRDHEAVERVPVPPGRRLWLHLSSVAAAGGLSDADILTSVRLIHRPDWSANCRGCGIVDNEYVQPWPCETAELFLPPPDHAEHPNGCQCPNLAGDCCAACHAQQEKP